MFNYELSYYQDFKTCIKECRTLEDRSDIPHNCVDVLVTGKLFDDILTVVGKVSVNFSVNFTPLMHITRSF